MALNISALLVYWLGSLVAYLGSERQKILVMPLNKTRAWTTFVATQIIAFVMLTQTHHWLQVTILLLVLTMLIWITLALVVPYFPKNRNIFFMGTITAVLIAIIGGAYVV